MFREDQGELRARKLKRALVSFILAFIWLAVLAIGAMAASAPQVAPAQKVALRQATGRQAVTCVRYQEAEKQW